MTKMETINIILHIFLEIVHKKNKSILFLSYTVFFSYLSEFLEQHLCVYLLGNEKKKIRKKNLYNVCI